MSYFKGKFFFLILFFIVSFSFVYAKKVDDFELYNRFIKTFLYDYNFEINKAKQSYIDLVIDFPENKELKKDYFFYNLKTAKAGKNIKKFQKLYSFGKQLLNEGYKSNFEVLINLAYICMKLEYYDEAKKYLEECVKNEAAIYNKNVYFMFGLVEFQLKNYQNAIEAFKEYYYTQPLDEKVIIYIADLNYKLGNFDDSLEFWMKIKNKNGEDYYSIILNIANVLENINKKKAEEYYNEILNSKASEFLKTEAYFRLGNLAFENNEYEKGKYYFEKVLKKAGKDLQKAADEKLCQISSIQKDYKTAVFYKIKAMKAAYSGKFENDQAQKIKYIDDSLHLSLLYDKLKNDEKSFEILEKLAQNCIDNERVKFFFGLKYYYLGDLEKAIFYIGKASELASKEKMEFYSGLVDKIAEAERFCNESSDRLKYKHKNQNVTDYEILSRNLRDYMKTLKTVDFYTKANLKFKMDDLQNTVLLDLFYSNFTDGELDVYLINGFYLGGFFVRDKMIFADEKKEVFFDISGKQEILKEFFKIFDFNLENQNLRFVENTKDGFKFTLNNYEFLLDKKGNLKYIRTEDLQIEFTKSANDFNLPTSIVFRNSENYLKFEFLNFMLSNEYKENLDEEIEKLNENKCKS